MMGGGWYKGSCVWPDACRVCYRSNVAKVWESPTSQSLNQKSKTHNDVPANASARITENAPKKYMAVHVFVYVWFGLLATNLSEPTITHSPKKERI